MFTEHDGNSRLPFNPQEASLSASLQQLGKSRADLWQFAGLVALERALERANRACDLDYWARQQVGTNTVKVYRMHR